MLRGDKNASASKTVGYGFIGRNGAVHTPAGKVRSTEDAIRCRALNYLVIAQQRIAQFDLAY